MSDIAPKRPASDRPASDRPASDRPASDAVRPEPPNLPTEVGGVPGLDPTRYGDWQHKGRCTDF